jgi:hypothetical protein
MVNRWIVAGIFAVSGIWGANALINPAGPSVTALSVVKGVTDPDAISTRLISSEDLPPEGTRSLFDHVVAQANGVPYPFEKLVQTIAKLDPTAQAPVVVMLPQGRSLLKAQANESHPRIVMAADFQSPNSKATLGLNTRGQLFLGFVENANEIEVLSYNEAAGRYEFQLVQDYSETGARKLVYAKRQVCTTCHQGGAPIFSQRPWAETNASEKTAEAIALARKAAGLNPDSYLGFPVKVGLDVPERLDELTDIGNFFAATQKLWLDACGEGEAGGRCRRQMLKLAVAYSAEPGGFNDTLPMAGQLRELQSKGMAGKNIQVPESDLSNRDPYAEPVGWRARLSHYFSKPVKPGDGAKSNEDLEAFDRLPKLPAVLDPLTLRLPKRTLTAKDIDGAYGLASLLTYSDIESLRSAAGGNLNVVYQAIDRAPASLFEAKPFVRVHMMQALLSPVVMAGVSASPRYAMLDTSEMSTPVSIGLPPLALHPDSPLNDYQKYCFSCHRGNPQKRLNFMAGADETEVLAVLKKKSEVREALDWNRYQGTEKASKLMPPTDSAQYRLMTSELKQNPQLLDKMRALVPGLFDF